MNEKYCNEVNQYFKTICKIQPEKNIEKSEMGFSQIYSELFKSELLYNVSTKSWFMYDGIRWREDVGGVYAAEKAKQMYKCLKTYAARSAEDESQTEQRDNFLKYVLKYGDYRKRETLVKDARSIMAIRSENFDCNAYLFNCHNCTINLKTLETHPHTPKDMISKVCGCDYIPEADITKWIRFIDEIMQGDKEKSLYLQRMCGYSLTPNTKLETAFFLYGATTRNGKSTFAETFRSMMGDYAAVSQPEVLAQTHGRNAGSASPEIARLAGVRFLNMSEPPKDMLLDVALFKLLTGGEKISARKLYENDFEFHPQFKLFINCNSLPRVTDDTLFRSDRVRIITFDRHFNVNERNKNLKQELQESSVLSSVLNWALIGLKDFEENGENPPACVIESTSFYKMQSDKLNQFINDCMCKSDKNTSGAAAFDVYTLWCKENGYSTEGRQSFLRALRNRKMLQEIGTVSGTTMHNVINGYEITETYKMD